MRAEACPTCFYLSTSYNLRVFDLMHSAWCMAHFNPDRCLLIMLCSDVPREKSDIKKPNVGDHIWDHCLLTSDVHVGTAQTSCTNVSFEVQTFAIFVPYGVRRHHPWLRCVTVVSCSPTRHTSILCCLLLKGRGWQATRFQMQCARRRLREMLTVNMDIFRQLQVCKNALSLFTCLCCVSGRFFMID